MLRVGFRSRDLDCPTKNGTTSDLDVSQRHRLMARVGSPGGLIVLMALLFAAALPLAAREKDKHSYGEGLIVNIPMPQRQVLQVVQDVAQNGVIRGTKEYSKDEYVSGAKAATSSHAFSPWNEGGKVFYKVREQALDPWNFKAGGDLGTLVVRYVVQPQGEKNTVLRIDAVFAAEYRHTVHPSDGTVEASEYKDIKDHLDAIEQMERQNAEAANEREQQLEKKQELAMRENTVPPAAAPAVETQADSAQRTVVTQPDQTPPGQTLSGDVLSGQNLEEHVKDLRKQVQRLVKAPGAPLKSAPFHTASTLDSLTPGTEVLILISTPYWYGVETRKGQRGWIKRDELEQP